MSTVVVATVKSNTSSPPAFQNTSGTEIGRLCRAFVNFDGTGTVAIRAQFNVSSITDNGTGDYTVNFTTAMVDANYTCTAVTSPDSANSRVGLMVNSAAGVSSASTTSAIRMTLARIGDGSATDSAYVHASIFR